MYKLKTVISPLRVVLPREGGNAMLKLVERGVDLVLSLGRTTLMRNKTVLIMYINFLLSCGLNYFVFLVQLKSTAD